MEILRHSQISVTMDIYSHVFPEVLVDAAEKMKTIFEVDLLPDGCQLGCQDGL